ncbi:MAG: ferrous iron transport protein A [Bacteroidota bacterium]
MISETSLSTMQPGDRGTIQRVACTLAQVRQRLLEMGLIKGTPIELVRFAPLGDPIEIRVRGYRLSLRKVEAESVIIAKDAT